MKFLTVVNERDELICSLVGDFIVDNDDSPITHKSYHVILSDDEPNFDCSQKGEDGNKIIKYILPQQKGQ